jgi:hypothetical protein
VTNLTVKNRGKRDYIPKQILELEGDFYIATNELPSYHTFRIFNQSGEILRGVFYADSKRNYTFLHRHECIPDVYKTTEHENIHAAIETIHEWETQELIDDTMVGKFELKMDDNEEHNMIRIALLPEEYFGF